MKRQKLSSTILLGAALTLFCFGGCDCEHEWPIFEGLQINEIRYVRGETSDDIACHPFIELKGEPGFEVGGLTINIFQGDTPYHSFTLPGGEIIPSDGYYVISSYTYVCESDASTYFYVDHQDTTFSAGPDWEWLPSDYDSGVTIILDLPYSHPGYPVVVDSVRYNPSGTPLEEDDSDGTYDGLLSWWEEADPLTDGVGEHMPAPGLPYYSSYDPVWGISRVGEDDTSYNSEDFLVASVTPGAENEKLYYDNDTEMDASWKPVINEVMPNTNGYADEGSFIEIYGPAGLRWTAGPGQYEIYALDQGSGHGDRSHYVYLDGSIPSDSYFVLADTENFSVAHGGEAPDQLIECADLERSSWDCAGSDEYDWNWMNNSQDYGIRIEYWIDTDRRIIVDSLRWAPSDPSETENLFRQGEGLAPEGDTCPATSFCRFGGDTHYNRNDFIQSDPSPGYENVEPSVDGVLESVYDDDFTQLGVSPASDLGKTVLFDQTKHQKSGSTGHWIIDDSGDYSDWAWQLFELGYTVNAVGTGDSSATETITAADLTGVDVLIMGEPQTEYNTTEKDALEDYLNRGGSLFFLANHRDSDRDYPSDGIDSWAVWNDNLDLDSYTGVSLADENTTGENLLLAVCSAAYSHDINTDIETSACDPATDTGCTLYDSVLYRDPGVGLYSGAFIEMTSSLPSTVTSVTELLEGERPYISRDPTRLDSYGGATPTETFAVAIILASGGRIVLLGDSAVLNDGGSSDYATYAAMISYCAYGLDHRNSLFGVNAVNWLAKESPTLGVDLPPSMEASP